jgi:hypothetical protein
MLHIRLRSSPAGGFCTIPRLSASMVASQKPLSAGVIFGLRLTVVPPKAAARGLEYSSVMACGPSRKVRGLSLAALCPATPASSIRIGKCPSSSMPVPPGCRRARNGNSRLRPRVSVAWPGQMARSRLNLRVRSSLPASPTVPVGGRAFAGRQSSILACQRRMPMLHHVDASFVGNRDRRRTAEDRLLLKQRDGPRPNAIADRLDKLGPLSVGKRVERAARAGLEAPRRWSGR